MKQFISTLIFLLLCGSAFGDSLNGSPTAIEEAKEEARRQGIKPVHTEEQMFEWVQKGILVRLEDGEHFTVAKMDIGKTYVLPETKMFITDFSDFLFEKCDRINVVTSALRLTTKQHPDSTDDSVHPTGMALDLRKWHLNNLCLDWFESRLRYLEQIGVIQATRETKGKEPHYHVTVYPEQYRTFSNQDEGDGYALYRVKRGETLSTIAKRFSTTLKTLVAINDLESPNRIWEGQKIKLF